MAKRKIEWTEKANFERKEILDYWIHRNKSKVYSIKLNQLFIETVKQIADSPTVGRKTDIPNVRVIIFATTFFFLNIITN